jgi:hypothetical protein
LAYGAGGSIFKLGCKRTKSGFSIYKYYGTDGWKRFSQAGAESIAVDAAGDPWVINNRKAVFRWSSMSERWVSMK